MARSSRRTGKPPRALPSSSSLAPFSQIGFGIRDACLAWRYFEPVTFQVGNFYEPASHRQNDFCQEQRFRRGGLPADLLTPNRHVGFAAVTGGDAPGVFGRPNWSFKSGIFSTSFEDVPAGAPAGRCRSCSEGRAREAPGHRPPRSLRKIGLQDSGVNFRQPRKLREPDILIHHMRGRPQGPQFKHRAIGTDKARIRRAARG